MGSGLDRGRFLFLSRLTSQDYLKVLTNEKRGGLTMISFDRSPFKLFSLWFSNKSMQAPSSERPKTTLRTLFLWFAINNCFATSDEKLLAVFELWGIFYYRNTTIRFCSKRRKCLFICLAHFCRCITDHCNDAKVTTAKLQTSRGFFALFENIYDGEPIFTDFSNIGKDV